MDSSSTFPEEPVPVPQSLRTPDSEPYNGDMTEFMNSQITIARIDDLEVQHREPADGDGGLSSARMAHFLKDPINVTVNGLCGCTAVAIVSQKGVWMAHIWEQPSLWTEDNFVRDVICVFRDGDSTLDHKERDWVPALADFAVPGAEFDKVYKPTIIIMTSQKINETQTGTTPVYEDLIDQLKTELSDIVPDAPIITTGYFPVEAEDCFDAKGKFLVQYTPALEIFLGYPPEQPHIQVARLRVYASHQRDPIYEHTWFAHKIQDQSDNSFLRSYFEQPNSSPPCDGMP